MPEQLSRRGLQITGASFESPFETPTVRFGLKGLSLKPAQDVVPPDAYRRFTNAVHDDNGQVTARPGLVDLTGAADDIHSVRRLNDPENDTFTRIWGSGNALGIGQAAITEVDTGYSTHPLSFVPYRPPLSSETWMFVGDSNKGRKIRSDGLNLPISPSVPSTAAVPTVAALETTAVCQFDTSDGSDGAQWTKNAGFDFSDPPNPTEIPITNDFASFSGNAIEFVANPSLTNAVFEAAKGYYSFWGLPRSLNLSLVGSQLASDEDIFHLYTKFSHPELTSEFRIYFVCSALFNPAVLPGTSFVDGENSDFYVKTWRQNDFSLFIQTKASQIDAAEVARVRAVRDQDLKNRAIDDDRTSWEERRAERDPARTISVQTGAGRNEWVEFGMIGTPVRRGEFQRIGATSGRDWSTVTGIVIYFQTVDGTGGQTAVSLEDLYLLGGYGPDTSTAGDQQYDYRYTHYDPRTGDESNPSPTMSESSFVDARRQQISVAVTANGDSAMRQRVYRRGGSLVTDWFFCGANDADGAAFVDSLTDDAIETAGGLELDNDAFLTSVDDNGDPIYEQPAPILFGPCQDLIFALGDPHRPGDVYWCKPGQPGSWPAANHTEVCAPGEPLMNGGVFAGQAFCFSTERGYMLYPNLSTTASRVTAAPTACKKGLIGRWAMTIGVGAIWFVAEDGIYRTTGGEAELVSDDLRPLFQGQTVESYVAVDLTAERFLRLEIHEQDLIFQYRGVDNVLHMLRYSILYNYWRPCEYNVELQCAYSDESADGTNALILGGWSTERAFVEGGTSDNGAAIAVAIRSGDTDFGRPREDKRLGDLYLDCAPNGADVTVATRLNTGSVVNVGGAFTGGGRDRFLVDPFGAVPQQARTFALDITWSTAGTPPILYQWGCSIIPQPDVTLTRVTQWEDLGHPDEAYLTGVTLDVDTNGGGKEFYVEYDDADTDNTWRTLGPYQITHTNRHKAKFSWPVVKAKLVRIRPSADCAPWQLYRVDWIFDPEPPRIARWDINVENDWDQYLTGLDLDCNTLGVTKTVELYLDGTLLQTYPVNAFGRRVVHLTVQPPVRGHLLRFVATDDHPGLLYKHRWHTDVEPSEQTNWNQNYGSWGYDADKWLKAVIFHCDTFAQNKNVAVEIDHAVVETLVVNANNRRVVEVALSEQKRGRIFRFLPVDGNPGRIYAITPVFDLEPLALTRWETQEVTAGIDGWKVALYAHVTYRAPAPVTLTVTAFNQDGQQYVRTYLLERTGTTPENAAKVPRYVPFERSKGMLYKFLLTSPQPFWLYREETQVCLLPWGSDARSTVKPFGNDDLDPSRGMGNAQLAAAAPGGMAK